jgi:hypothetical protein
MNTMGSSGMNIMGSPGMDSIGSSGMNSMGSSPGMNSMGSSPGMNIMDSPGMDSIGSSGMNSMGSSPGMNTMGSSGMNTMGSSGTNTMGSSGMNSISPSSGMNTMGSASGTIGIIPSINNYPLNIPNVEKEQKVKAEVEQHKKKSYDSVYVDLNCFLDNMDNLKNHSKDMMIDLELLTSNIKTCSYIKKIPEITNKVNVLPEPSTIRLKNVQANILMTNDGSPRVLEIAKEPDMIENFDVINDWSFEDLIKILIVILLIGLLLHRS